MMKKVANYDIESSKILPGDVIHNEEEDVEEESGKAGEA